jgi:hypothetical protein
MIIGFQSPKKKTAPKTEGPFPHLRRPFVQVVVVAAAARAPGLVLAKLLALAVVSDRHQRRLVLLAEPLREITPLFEFSRRSSRACLGKTITLDGANQFRCGFHDFAVV